MAWQIWSRMTRYEPKRGHIALTRQRRSVLLTTQGCLERYVPKSSRSSPQEKLANPNVLTTAYMGLTAEGLIL